MLAERVDGGERLLGLSVGLGDGGLVVVVLVPVAAAVAVATVRLGRSVVLDE